MSLTKNILAASKNVSSGLVLLTLFVVNPLNAAEDCRAIKDDAERLACYDRLMAPPVPESAPAPVETAPVTAPAAAEVPPARVETTSAPAPAAEQASAPTPGAQSSDVLDDNIGIENVKGREDELTVLVKGRVTSCRKDQRSKYRFYFDNGQIWQQKDNRTVPWKECNFDVTIEKDFFGYKMLPEGEKRSIRIARIK